MVPPKEARACGECSLCCKLFAVQEIDKPIGQWCPHCEIGSGCQIYESRPLTCRAFECLWLMNPDIPDAMRSERVKAFLSATTDGKNLVVHCDTRQPDAYKKGVLQTFVSNVKRSGTGVVVVCGSEGKVLTE